MSFTHQRHRSGFFYREAAGVVPSRLELELDRIAECMDFYRDHDVETLLIRSNSGIHLKNLEFLQQYPLIRSVHIPDQPDLDIEGLRYLSDSLTELTLSQTKPGQGIDVGMFPNLESLCMSWRKRTDFSFGCRRLRNITLYYYKPRSRNLEMFPALPALERLELVHGNLTSLRGINSLSALSQLELHLCRSLNSIDSLEELMPSQLVDLRIFNCRRVSDYRAIQKMTGLRILRLISCGQIDSLGFTKSLQDLKDLRIIDTNVLDGDMTPFLRVDSLAVSNRSHHSHTEKELLEAIRNRKSSQPD